MAILICQTRIGYKVKLPEKHFVVAEGGVQKSFDKDISTIIVLVGAKCFVINT